MALKVHHLRPAPGARTQAKRVGRGEGGKGGKTAGRGTKGSGARKNVPESFEGGQWITAEAPLERIPVYLRDGARLPIRGEIA